MSTVPSETQPAALDFSNIVVRGLTVFRSIVDAGSIAGVDPTGASDSYAALQGALNAAPANGGGGHGVVFLPPGIFLLSQALVPPDGVAIVGSGRGRTTLKIGGDFAAIQLGLIPANFYTIGVTLRDLTIDCSAQTQGGARGGLYAQAKNGLNLQGVNNLYVDGVEVLNPSGYGMTIGGGGYNVKVSNVRVRNVRVVGEWNGYDAIGGGAIDGGYIENYQSIDNAGSASDLVWINDFTWRKVAVTQPTYGFTNGPIGIGTDSGASNIVIDDLSVDSCKIAILISGFANAGASGAAPYNIHISKLRATNCGQAIYFNAASGLYASYVTISDFVVTGHNKNNNASPAIQLAGSRQFTIANGMVNAPSFNSYAIKFDQDAGGNVCTNGTIRGVDVRGTLGMNLASVDPAGTVRIKDCPGFNPLSGSGTQPVVSASGTTYTNATGVDAVAYVSGGTMTSPTIVGGKGTGFTTGAFRVPAGGTIELFYSAAPTWAWVYD